MKKSICLIIILILILTLSSCIKGTPTSFLIDSDNELADTRIEQLFNAIKEQDKVALKETFSQKAIEEAKDIDDELDELLSFIQGEVVSWSRDESPVAIDTVEYGKKTKQLEFWYNLKTNEQTYLIFLVDYPIDTIESENEGLYSLRILKIEDERKLTGTWDDWTIPGVYILNK